MTGFNPNYPRKSSPTSLGCVVGMTLLSVRHPSLALHFASSAALGHGANAAGFAANELEPATRRLTTTDVRQAPGITACTVNSELGFYHRNGFSAASRQTTLRV